MVLPRARVFISCGQRGDREKELGFACRDYLERRGFRTYLAEEVQSLEALTDNIFNHLRNSEYAVFIDCLREELRPDGFRGSIFVNQELAIAAFLQIDSRVFHEKGLVREGVVDYLIAKPIHFTSKQNFVRKLRYHTREWDSGWTNELSLITLPVVPNVRNEMGNYADWYHIQVINNHKDKYARNCIAYLLKIKNLYTNEEIKPCNLELIWAGTGLFERHILPKRAAEIDALFIIRGQDVIRFHHRPSTSTQYIIPPLRKGNYALTYTVISQNFEQVTKEFNLNFGGSYDSTEFT